MYTLTFPFSFLTDDWNRIKSQTFQIKRSPFIKDYEECKCWCISRGVAVVNHCIIPVFQRLEQQQNHENCSGCFSRTKRLDISVSNFHRKKIGFYLSVSISCRVLYGNKVKDLSSGVFQGLTSLQLL